MRLLPILLAASLVVLAADQDTAKKPAVKATTVTTEADRTKAADAWVANFSKSSLPESAPRWYDIFSALEKKYGVGKIPCDTFDAARQKYFQEFILPLALKEGYNSEETRLQFIKQTDLPTTWTITGKQRQGCASK